MLYRNKGDNMHKKSCLNIVFNLFFITIFLTSLLPSKLYPWAINSISFFSPRSQGTNSARDYAGVWRYRIKDQNKKLNGYLEVTPTYTHYLRGHRMADQLFGTNTLKISGSMVPLRERQDLLADYFGLSPSFESIVQLKPRIQNGLVVFNGHIGFDNWVTGLYLDVIAPFGWTQWKLSLEEVVLSDTETTDFPAGYMAPEAVTPPIKNFKQALSGNVQFGDMNDPIKFGKISPKALSVQGSADVGLALGWNFLQTDTHHLGCSLRFTVPAGNRPCSEFFFEPVLGNGKHVEAGIGLDGHVLLWEKDGNQELCVFGSVNGTHLFGSKQRRSFDLGCHHSKALSRYMLLKEFDNENRYTGRLTPLINHTTLPCSVRINIQTDILIMFDYMNRGYTCDIGYNGFIRSKEIISIPRDALPSRTFGLKGIQNVSHENNGNNNSASDNSIDNSTQSNATIFGNAFDQQEEVADQQSPYYIRSSDIDATSAASPRIITHKLFGHFGYRKMDYAWGQPFCGIGGEIEFEGVNPRNRTEPVHDTLGLWGLWLKFGIFV